MFPTEKELFEKKMKEAEEKREELDSGIGSRNESAEVYDADADKSGIAEQMWSFTWHFMTFRLQ